MDAWHRKIAVDLLAEAGPGSEPSAELEIAFGAARSAVVYVLELARAHRLTANGQVAGDDIWLQLGRTRVRFTLNRRESLVAVDGLHSEVRYRWDVGRRCLQDESGASVELSRLARATLDELVKVAQRDPALAAPRRASAAPPPDPDDEPTKG